MKRDKDGNTVLDYLLMIIAWGVIFVAIMWSMLDQMGGY